MKTLKLIFSLLILFTILSSCTPQALDDDQTNTINNTQATGDEGASSDDGSKD